jgi:hypothetical protein
MISKLFELRDKNTFIPILAIKLTSESEKERYLLARAGFSSNKDVWAGYVQAEYIQLIEINGGGGKSNCDPYEWASRTHQIAHRFILDNFNTLESGQVIDVEFILGETTQPKKSEALNVGF